ncbi:DUF185-domain-containing protein [Trametopsis cervina]|nr:DUF185-domain-containing protein [Trametopsis cervina]
MRNRILSSLTSPSHLYPSLARCRGSRLRSWDTALRCVSTFPPVTKVEKLVLDTIKATGPISFSTYMQMCLSHPTEGYYSNPSHPVFGTKGDFITSPEISQVFGELLAIWLLSQWLNTGRSKPIRLVELGPGRGTLMADILRVFSQFPAARAAVKEVTLVENSDSMQKLQQEKLQPLVDGNKWTIAWANSIEEVNPSEGQYTMIIAHEFFDALPFHLLERSTQGWREVLITSDPDPAEPIKLTSSSPLLEGSTRNAAGVKGSSRLRPVISSTPSATANLLGASSPRFDKLPVGSRLEVSPTAFKVARRIGEILHSASIGGDGATGCALIVDYGGEKSYGNSFRAFKDHKIVDVFERPGECDLTTNVDFAYLKDAIADLAMPLGLLPQGIFLTRMGLQLRVEALKKVARDETRKMDIEKAANRLVDATGMGSQYQVFAISGSTQHQSTPEQRWPFIDKTTDLRSSQSTNS